jgi:hypothetical protein
MNNVNVRNLKGENGATVVPATKSATGSFGALQCITASQLSALGSNYDQSLGSITGKSLPAGTVLYGRFTNLTVSSGLVMAYHS